MTPDQDEIQALAGEIGRRFDPERVILFGSHARGTTRPDSDVDLLVVTEYEGSSVDKALEMLRGLNRAYSVDLLVRSPSELDQRVRLGDFFLRDILREGKVLYERAHSGVGEQSRGRLRQRAA